jgi:hypothetical protein
MNQIMPKITALCFCLCLLVLASCSSIQRFDDAVRIKQEYQSKYESKSGESIQDGRTLKGTVVEIIILPRKNFPEFSDTIIVFLPNGATNDKENYQKIPFSEIDRIAQLTLSENKFGNINVFENYNSTEGIRQLRSVPVRNFNFNECDCLPLDVDFSIDLPGFKCPERQYALFFFEARGVVSAYSLSTRVSEEANIGYGLEGVAGMRFGGMNEWGIGLATSTPIISKNTFTGAELNPQPILLHLRYQMSKNVVNFLGLCMKPFAYGQIGATFDEVSLNLFKLNFAPSNCSSCNQLVQDLQTSGQLPEVDFSMPISFGTGIGVEIPIMESLDLGIDLGWRSLAYGELVPSTIVAGFTNVPSMNRINTFHLRFGLTF